ncbi:MAG: class I SAM-dependent methyltransferase [Kiritimatiellae bacterium]|nr:class I SAM-dependent methyltransferase [Kiritimatiellia bacterium]
MDIRTHNREAWDRQVAKRNPWTVPVSAQQVADARAGRWAIFLTPARPVPSDWFPPLPGTSVLCLASGGGQQGPILAAAGAEVTVLDNSPRQLEQDRRVAERDGLALRTVEGDMRDLSCFKDAGFDLIVHPVSNTFVPDVEPVWREAWRVLRPGGALLAGFDNPVVHVFDAGAYERGELTVAHALPYSEADSLSEAELAQRRRAGAPLEFGHTLEALIGGQIQAGFVIVGFYEDRYPDANQDLLGRYTATFIVTRAHKRAACAKA